MTTITSRDINRLAKCDGVNRLAVINFGQYLQANPDGLTEKTDFSLLAVKLAIQWRWSEQTSIAVRDMIRIAFPPH